MAWLLQTLLSHPLLSWVFVSPCPCLLQLLWSLLLGSLGLSGFASVPALSLAPSAVPLSLSLSSSLSRVYVSVGLPVGSSQPLSAPALLSIPSFCDWLSYKPFSQELCW